VNTGEVVAGDPEEGQTLVTGDTVNVAARLEQAAEPGEILIGEATFRLVRGAVTVEPVEPLVVRGKEDGVVSWRVLGVGDGAPALDGRLESPLVGRARELGQLRQAFEHAVKERRAYLFTVLGGAGIGKSRLARELGSELEGEARVVTGRCLPYGEGITFFPLFEIVRDLVGEASDSQETIAALVAREEAAEQVAEQVAERVVGAIGSSEAEASAEETFWAVRKLFEALAGDRPLVVVFEDIHWGEPTFLDMVEHIVDWSRDAPIFILCNARPDLLEKRPRWSGGKLNSTSILLGPLTEDESTDLIDRLLGETVLPPAIRARIAEAGAGNPLFVEQLVAMLAEGEPDGDRLEIPPTIQALLAARLDRLGAEERAVIERSAIVGNRFWAAAVVGLSPEAERASVQSCLQELVRKDLIAPEKSIVLGEEGYRFRHLLIRDAAYNGIPKTARAELHEQFARLIEERAGATIVEIEEILGYHLEQAFRYRTELGPADEHARELAAMAAGRLGAAGGRALTRGDATAAASLLRRAAALLPAGSPARGGILASLGSSLVPAGEFREADAVLSEAIETAAASGDRRLELHVLLERAFLRALTDPGESVEELRRAAEEAVPELERLGDDLGLAKAWRRIADVNWMLNHWTDQAGALERALEHARRAGDHREAAGALMRMPMSLYYGPLPVPEAAARAEAILEQAAGAQVVQSTALVCLAALRAFSGRFEEARDLLDQGRAISDELGFRVWVAGFSLAAGDIEMLAGEPKAAERELRRGYQALEAMGERGLLATVAAELARAVCLQGRYVEAEELTRVSESLARPADVSAQIAWRAVRGHSLAGRGDLAAAEALAREALALTERTDDLNRQARVLVDLANIVRRSGREDEAVPLLEGALELLERKGNVVAAADVRGLLVTSETR
jgi:tetratricopeptide (TPR) repeat protein